MGSRKRGSGFQPLSTVPGVGPWVAGDLHVHQCRLSWGAGEPPAWLLLAPLPPSQQPADRCPPWQSGPDCALVPLKFPPRNVALLSYIQSTLWTPIYPHPSQEGLKGCTLNGRNNQGPGRGKRCPGVPCLPLPQPTSLGWEMRCRTAWGLQGQSQGEKVDSQESCHTLGWTHN